QGTDVPSVITPNTATHYLRHLLLSHTKMTTATRTNSLPHPHQALTVRRQSDLEQKNADQGAVQAAAPQKEASKDKKDEELQGVFVIRNKKAEFVPVETGVTGTTDIEVLKGLKEGDQIITGSYKVLRTLRPGASIKVDNSAPKKQEEGS